MDKQDNFARRNPAMTRFKTTMKIIVEQTHEMERWSIQFGFVDFEKAFDSICKLGGCLEDLVELH